MIKVVCPSSLKESFFFEELEVIASEWVKGDIEVTTG